MKKIIPILFIVIFSGGLISQESGRNGEIEVTNAAGDSVAAFSIDENKIQLNAKQVLVNGFPVDPFSRSYNLLWSYDAEQEAATGSDDYMFVDAFSKAGEVYIPWRYTGPYIITGTVDIPSARKMVFK